jgi:hypothetical protein
MAITTIRPNATVHNGSWRKTPEGTLDLHTPTSDDADSTYIRGNVGYPLSGYYCRIAAGDVSVSATQRVMRCRVRVRYAKNGAGGGVQLATITLHDPIPQRSVTAQWIRTNTTAETTQTFGWWTTAPQGVWTQEIVNRMTFFLVSYNNVDHSALFPHIQELWADVDIHTQVSISGLTVTGHTTSARPTVSWTYNTNVDEDPQRSYQVKIFTLAQTTAAGFDAATTQAEWDSGLVRSAAENAVATKSLVNGITYKAYVRAASDFNNTDWWTSFSPSSNFTMAYVAPPTPTLTVTPETAVPSLRNLLTVDTKLNLLTADDASFETLIGTWTANANVTVVRSNTQALDGIWSMQMTATAAANMSAITVGGVFGYPITVGQQYTALASFRAGTTGQSCRVLIQWLDNAGVLVSTSTGSNVTDTTGGWTQGFVTATAPAGTSLARIVVEVLSAGAAEIHYVDQVSLHTGSSTTWTAGGLQKQDSIGFERVDRTVIEFLDWTMPTSDTTNIINPNIADGGEAYNDPNHGFFKRNAEDRIALDRSGLARQGEACIRWTIGDATGSILDIGTPVGSYSWTEVPTATLPGVPDRTYTVSGYVRAISGSHDVALAVVAIDATGATVGSTQVGSTISTGTTFVRHQIAITVPAGAAGMRGELRNLNGDLAEYLLDQFQLEEGSTATAWQRSTFMIPNWLPVRGALTALQASERDGIARIYDREMPPGVIRMYRAATQVDAGEGAFARSAYTAYVPTTIDPFGGTEAILKDPQQPAWDTLVRVQELGESISEDFTEAHPVRPNDRQPFGKRPVTVSDWISGKNGQASIFVDNDETWLKVQALLHTPRTLLLQFPEGGQRYVRFKSRSWPKESKAAVDGGVAYWRRIVVGFDEAPRPVVTA